MDEATGEIGGNELDLAAPPRAGEMELDRSVGQGLGVCVLRARATPRTRKIALRTSLVFSPASGSVFATLSHLVRAGLGGTQGNGRQLVSWMHESD